MKPRYSLPALLMLGLLALLGYGLTLDPREVPSPLIGEPAPAFSMPTLKQTASTFTERDLLGQAALVNFWASWCAACRDEHPLLMRLAGEGVRIIGIAYKDEPEAAAATLAAEGDPYRTVALDIEGRVGIDWGVYGVPETYVVDAKGVILRKHIGALTPEAWDEIRGLLR